MKKNDDLITLPSHNSHALDYIIKKRLTPRKTKTYEQHPQPFISYNKEESNIKFPKNWRSNFFRHMTW
uniref:Uncharacterized protein n=1 Tax=Escherichia coli TaxID=562 RepID=A0A0C5B145_ECOLX|nr:hypothetical protein pCTXM132_P0421_81 [Escherichia coli]